MSNIDFDFILKQEGFETEGYVPDAENSKSGVTIASGFDLGARVLEDLKGLPNDIVELLTPFLSLKGAEAQEVASNLNVSEDQAKIINEFAKSEAITNLKTKWETSTGTSFDTLSKEQATVLASVAFQYGDLESRTPNFWKQATSGDWEGAYNNLLNFGDRYDSRRKDEANYLFPTLKKTDTSLIDNQLKADALRMDGTIPEIMLNPYIDDEAKTEIVANEVDNALGSETFNAITDTVSNVANSVTEYVLPSTRPEEIKQNEGIVAKDFIDSLEPPQMWDIDYTRPYDKEDLLYLEQKQQTISKELENKYTWLEETGAAYQQEWMGTNLWEQFSAENLKPDPDFVLSKDNLDRYMEDLPENFREEFAYAHSEAHAMQIRSQLLEHLEMEERIYSDGQFSGTMKRLLAAFTDPMAYAAIIGSEGLLAPVVVLQKMGRVGRILKRGIAGGASFGVIEGYLASQRPDLDVDDVMHGILTGAFLGGLFGIKKPRVKSDSFTKMYKDGLDEQNAKLNPPDPKNPKPSGGGTPLVTPDNPNPLKADGTRVFDDVYNETYDMALATTKRKDGRFEIALNRTNNGDDEVIMQVNKDGTVEVRKCK